MQTHFFFLLLSIKIHFVNLRLLKCYNSKYLSPFQFGFNIKVNVCVCIAVLLLLFFAVIFRALQQTQTKGMQMFY